MTHHRARARRPVLEHHPARGGDRRPLRHPGLPPAPAGHAARGRPGLLPLRHRRLVHESQHPRRRSAPLSPLRLLARRPDRAAARAAGRDCRLVRPPALGGVVVVHDDGRDIGRTIESCAEALADAGVTWTGELVRVTDVGLVAPAVVRALGALTPGVVAVPSLGRTRHVAGRAVAGAVHADPPRLAGGVGQRRRGRPARAAAATVGPRRARRRAGHGGELGFASQLLAPSSPSRSLEPPRTSSVGSLSRRAGPRAAPPAPCAARDAVEPGLVGLAGRHEQRIPVPVPASVLLESQVLGEAGQVLGAVGAGCRPRSRRRPPRGRRTRRGPGA